MPIYVVEANDVVNNYTTDVINNANANDGVATVSKPFGGISYNTLLIHWK